MQAPRRMEARMDPSKLPIRATGTPFGPRPPQVLLLAGGAIISRARTTPPGAAPPDDKAAREQEPLPARAPSWPVLGSRLRGFAGQPTRCSRRGHRRTPRRRPRPCRLHPCSPPQAVPRCARQAGGVQGPARGPSERPPLSVVRRPLPAGRRCLTGTGRGKLKKRRQVQTSSPRQMWTPRGCWRRRPKPSACTRRCASLPRLRPAGAARPPSRPEREKRRAREAPCQPRRPSMRTLPALQQPAGARREQVSRKITVSHRPADSRQTHPSRPRRGMAARLAPGLARLRRPDRSELAPVPAPAAPPQAERGGAFAPSGRRRAGPRFTR